MVSDPLYSRPSVATVSASTDVVVDMCSIRRCRSSLLFCSHVASSRATASLSTCRWFRKPSSPCWRALASAPFTRWSSADSRRRSLPPGSITPRCATSTCSRLKTRVYCPVCGCAQITNKYVVPPYSRAEMYAGRVAWCPWWVTVSICGRDRQTDARPFHYAFR